MNKEFAIEISTEGFARVILPLIVLLLLSFMSLPVSADHGLLPIMADTTLTGDLFGHIDIIANGVTLDCAGFTVEGVGVGVGILLDTRTGVTVQNCNVTGFDVGIELSLSSLNTLVGNTAELNEFGFLLLESLDNTLESNTANENLVGFLLEGSPGNTLLANTANNNLDIGFSVEGGSSNNLLVGNTAEVNELGFLVFDSSGNDFGSNTAIDNGIGFQISELSSLNILESNTANSNIAKVEKVDYEWGDFTGKFPGFFIKY